MFDSVRAAQGGSYSVRSAELAQNGKSGQRTLCVNVLFLDDTQQCFTLEKRAKASLLLDQVFSHLELTERDYFGLQYIDTKDIVRWLDANKPLKKQLNSAALTNGGTIPTLHFRVKFYVCDPVRLQEEYSRYQLYLQVRRDIFNQKLPLSHNTACLLASYTVQAELGDYSPSEHTTGYLSTMQLLSVQTPEDERRICELHKLHRGQLPSDAELNYLEHAKRLDLYGVELHKASDSSAKDILLGVTAIGLVVIQNNIRVNTFSWSKIVKVSFKRKNFFIQLRREPSESYDTLLGFTLSCYRSSKTLWKSCVEHHTFFRLHTPQRNRINLGLGLSLRLGSKFHYSGRTQFQTAQECKTKRMERVFVRSPSRRIPSEKSTPPQLLVAAPPRPPRPHDNKVTSTGPQQPRKAWENHSDDEGGFLPRTVCQIGYVDDDIGDKVNSDSALYDTPPYSETQSPIPQLDGGLVTIRLTADDQGRFGFNVKGGLDLGLPILVSRVAPNTPADRCSPKLCEGDQVVMINGRDVSNILHEQVVSLIRASRESRTGELVLTVRPNMLINVYEEEPLYQYVPDNQSHDNGAHIIDTLGESNALSQSMLLLYDGLSSGALILQYEQLYRKNNDLTVSEAKKPENLAKNRYRDISPYDCTRFILNNWEGGDYINANYVSMEISGSGVINRYIATQGPLASTVGDFWHMVLQSNSRLIVMLTTVTERGRVKCHQYWPTQGDVLKMQNMTVKCEKESADCTGSFVFRELLLIDSKSGERRTIQHMQYLAWPDHGVPSDPEMFLHFTERVRNARNSQTTSETQLKSTMQSPKSPKHRNSVPLSPKSIKSSKSSKSTSQNDLESKTLSNTSLKSIINESILFKSPRHSYQNVTSSSTSPSHKPEVHTSEQQPPVIVHCSAGIGRTGVLILMDTALCLMQHGEPIYPLDIVQAMRDQRAMMIQNASQYRFVCECVHAAHTHRITTEMIR